MSNKGHGSDGLGEMSGESTGKLSFKDAAAAAVPANATPATLLSSAEFTRRRARVYALFGAKTQEDKTRVDAALVVYFIVHGTSPDTHWVNEPPIEAVGKVVSAADVVEAVGPNLKKYLGHWSAEAIEIFQEHPRVQRALKERIARSGLSEADGHLVIDFVGKDGSLDGASMRLRGFVRRHLVTERNDARRIAQADVTTGMRQMSKVSESHAEGPIVDPF